MNTVAALEPTRREADDGYPQLEALVARRVADAKPPLFTTNAEGLFETFLANLPADSRQHYACNCCRRFVDAYGGLVTIGDDGDTQSLMWVTFGAGFPAMFQPAAAALADAVRRAKVNGVFVSAAEVWGTPSNVPGPGSKYEGQRWSHLSGQNPNVWRDKVKTDSQRMAEWREDFGVLVRGLEEYRRDVIAEAVRVLEADALDRAEKALELGRWFLALKETWETERGPAKTNLLWRAVATAPPGWCHVKNTMIATLLDDVAAGMDFATVSKRWSAKMHPLQYQRPTALKAGNLDAAEKLIATLGAAKSLERRFARLDEVVALWRPKAEEAKPDATGGVFGHLRTKVGDGPVKPLALPPKTLTWVRFAAEVLPTARTVDILIPYTGPFYGLVTAAHADAPVIVQWDGIDGARNPVSWYFHHPTGSAAGWSLTAGAWEPVGAICLKPPHWHRPDLFAHHEQGVMFAVPKAKDVRRGIEKRGGGLFPELVRAEFRDAKAAIEAYSNGALIGGGEEGNANGLSWNRGQTWPDCRLRVTGDGGVTEYRIDRWE